jgi:hypothetical protein
MDQPTLVSPLRMPNALAAVGRSPDVKVSPRPAPPAAFL